MIHFVVTERGSFSMRYYLAEEGEALGKRMRVVLYEELASLRQLPLGTWVFTEFDQLDEPQRNLAIHVWDRLGTAPAGVRLTNDARRVRSRVDVLRAAHDAGVNEFRAWPATDVLLRPSARARVNDGTTISAGALRYPVFVRFTNRHVGNLTPLLDSPRSLESALSSLMASRMRLDELLVVEFCDTRDEHGIFRKYSAYMIGDRIVPRYLECSRDWMVKWDARIFDRVRADEEARYLETNPHESWIRDVFRLARIDYGRIDYGVRAGKPQLWEINTNPTIGRGPGPKGGQPAEVVAYKAMLAPAFDAFFRNFQEAWEAIDVAPQCYESVELRAPSALLRDIERAARQRRRADRLGSLVHLVAKQEWVRPITRAAKRALASVAGARLRNGI